MINPALSPNNNFSALLGADGIGKSSIAAQIGMLGAENCLVLNATKPTTWPGIDYSAGLKLQEAQMAGIVNSSAKAAARQEYSDSVLAANYRKVGELLLPGITVVNDSDIVCKNLMGAYLDGESLNARFRDMEQTIVERADGLFPGHVFYISAPGDIVDQTSIIDQRLNQRGVYSPSDPVKTDDIRRRLEACESVVEFLEKVGTQYDFHVHRLTNETAETDDQRAAVITELARRVLSVNSATI